MTADSTSHSVVIDAELLRGMTRDATIFTLTRPLAIIAYTALIAAFIVNAALLGMISPADEEQRTSVTLTLVAIAALIVASIIFTRASNRRAISTAMPSGSSVRAEVHEESIVVASKRGVSDMPFTTFRTMRVGRHAVLLLLRGDSVVTAVPRVLLSDAGVAQLKSKI
ncbi:YcxB family protein [Microbacterium sp.]|uniref:YcxB family protein n=1 Tax=Microbacterium sp. TaxID=51671 RepID=UPI003A95AE43